MPDTIESTAKNAGWLDLKLVPERRNTVKVLMFLDIGGSMDPHVKACEELFSAARTEFKNLEFFYFHNCIYESVWKDNRRRHDQRIATHDVLHRYGGDYKLVFVGDASMSPLELIEPGGSIEHWNEESGMVWLQRVLATWPRTVWLNPAEREYWNYTPTIQHIQRAFGERMFPLTLDGLDGAMRELVR
mgnify:CR=1 FL=1